IRLDFKYYKFLSLKNFLKFIILLLLSFSLNLLKSIQTTFSMNLQITLFIIPCLNFISNI
ncbi:hypothetical protein BpHYR1_025000, partial [Brachionus plicatilis]